MARDLLSVEKENTKFSNTHQIKNKKISINPKANNLV